MKNCQLASRMLCDTRGQTLPLIVAMLAHFSNISIGKAGDSAVGMLVLPPVTILPAAGGGTPTLDCKSLCKNDLDTIANRTLRLAFFRECDVRCFFASRSC